MKKKEDDLYESFIDPFIVCDHCNGRDLVEDYQSGFLVCQGCGCCHNNSSIKLSTFEDVKPLYANNSESVNFVNTPIVNYRGNYKEVSKFYRHYQRKSYFNERISQWCCSEPKIKHSHLDKLFEAYDATIKDGIIPENPRDPLTKNQIRSIFRYLNLPQQKKNKFVKRYYEKWMSIRYLLTGHPSLGMFLGGKVEKSIKLIFQSAEIAFEQNVKVGSDRTSMPSYNFIFRRALDLCGYYWAAKDFPPLQTPQRRKTLIELWLEICIFNQWVYINNDWIIWPDYFVYLQCYPYGAYSFKSSKRRKATNPFSAYYTI